jgi:hypothetical protein
MIRIPRMEDLPYNSSPPIQFVYQSTAPLSLGSYTWTDGPKTLTPDRPLMNNSLYYFRSVTLSANIDELDYTSNITTTPKFQMYLKSRAKAIFFREPILFVKYLQNFEFRQAWLTQMVSDQLFGGFTGVLIQGPALIGKASITLTAVISAQEIVDDSYIREFYKKYPGSGDC